MSTFNDMDAPSRVASLAALLHEYLGKHSGDCVKMAEWLVARGVVLPGPPSPEARAAAAKIATEMWPTNAQRYDIIQAALDAAYATNGGARPDAPPALGALETALSDAQSSMEALKHPDKHGLDGCHACHLERALERMRGLLDRAVRGDARGAPEKPKLCAHRFDATICVGEAGHEGPHLTSNAAFPQGIRIEAWGPRGDGGETQ